MFGLGPVKCTTCANHSGTPASGGICRVWGAVVAKDSSLVRQCPHWTSAEAMRTSVAAH